MLFYIQLPVFDTGGPNRSREDHDRSIPRGHHFSVWFTPVFRFALSFHNSLPGLGRLYSKRPLLSFGGAALHSLLALPPP